MSNTVFEEYGKKFVELWNSLGEEIKWAAEVTEIRLQMEFLEAKQNRFFREYGRKVYETGLCVGPDVEDLLREIRILDEELKKRCEMLERLKVKP